MGSHSTSITTQKDERTAVEGSEGAIVAAPESYIQFPFTTHLTVSGKVGQYIEQFPPEVAAALGNILQSNEEIIGQIIGFSKEAMQGLFASTQQLGEKLSEAKEPTETSSFTKFLPYIVLAFLAVIVLTR
ncbi:MAG TPA: hypothetical protein VMW16_08685 [Sedimentisphaerales bacterium]|nr:hypothetical protein [Sedimentisphaerales bacterium]